MTYKTSDVQILRAAPAISKHPSIQELETFFGTDLLTRMPLEQTQAGHRLKVIALELKEVINDIKRAGRLSGADSAGLSARPRVIAVS